MMLIAGAASSVVATNAPVQLSATLTNTTAGPRLVLSWPSQPGAIYKLQGRARLSPAVPWQTVEVFQPTGTTSRVMLDGDPLQEESHFMELLLPQPEIFSVEPARFALGGATDLYVIGQCLDTTTELRVGPLALTNRVVLHPGLMRVTFTPTAPGTYAFDLVRTGAVLSSFLVECFEAGAPPSSVLQAPPDEPLASPRKVPNKGSIKGSVIINNAKRFATTVSPSGEVETDEVDLFIPGRGLDFIWGRRYRSRSGPITDQGNRWDFSYNVRAQQVAGGMEIRDGMGRADVFRPDADGVFGRDEHFSVGTLTGVVFRLTFADTGYWEFLPLDGSMTAGRLSRIVDRNANAMRMEYDGLGRLSRVIDTLDRTNSIAYSPASGKISSLTDFTGRRVTYAHYRAGEAGGNEGDLKSVTSPAVTGTPNGNDFPNGKTTTYTYTRGFADPRQNSLLLAITDARGQTAHRHVYQHNQTDLEFLRCIGQQVGTTNDRITYAYLPQTPAPSNQFAVQKIIVNDRMGNVSEHSYDARHRPLLERAFTGRAVPGLRVSDTTNRPAGKLRQDDPPHFETRYEWNNDSLCTRVLHPRGNATELVYQRAFNQNSARSNHPKRHDGDLRVLRERACCGGADTDGDGSADFTERTVRFQYDSRFGSDLRPWLDELTSTRLSHVHQELHRPPMALGFSTSVTDARGGNTVCTYDPKGNLLEVRHPDPVGAENFEYNGFGQRTAQVHFADAENRRRRDENAYYSGGPQNGYLRHRIADCIATGFHTTNTYEYDARGNMTRHTDPRGFDTLWSYNALDQLMQAQTPPNTTYPYIQWNVALSYDANDNLIRVDTDNRDHTGALDAVNPLWTTDYTYDVLDRIAMECIEIAHEGLKACTSYEYDANGNLALKRSPEAVNGNDPNNIVAYQYDERDMIFQVLPAPGTGQAAVERFDYDGNGNTKRVSKIDAFTIKQSVFEHDGFDRRVRATDAMGNVETCAYDRIGNLVYQRLDGETNDVTGSAQNRRLSETRYEYDLLNRVTRFRPAFFDIFTELAISDGEATTTLTYAPNGQLTSETDDNGRTTRYTYDSLWRRSSVIDPKTNSVLHAYDACDHPTNVTSIERSDLGGPEQRFSVSSTYDPRGRLVTRADNTGNTDQYFYDSRGNLVRHTDPRGNLTGWMYDGLSRRTLAIADLNGDGLLDVATDAASAQAWDDNSRLASSTDGNGNTTSYAYDSVDRLVRTTRADGTTESLVWSPRSNLARRTDPNGTVCILTHDLNDRCVRKDITPAPGVAATTTFEQYAYDGLSRLVLGTNNTSMVEFGHDSLGNREKSKQDCIAAFATHDGEGNRLSLTHPSGRMVTTTYDALNQPVSLGLVVSGRATALAAFAYDGPGRLARLARASGINTRINWNGLSGAANPPGDFGWRQVARVNHARSGGSPVIDQRVLAYDRGQNKTVRGQTTPFVQGTPTITNAWSYDALDRLQQSVRVQGTVSDFRQYQLDRNGNRQAVIENGAAGLYAMDNTAPDPADFQMNQYTFTPFGGNQYDRNGNLTVAGGAAGETVYHYDFADRLVHVERAIGPALVPVATYTYDVLGRRITKTTYPPAPSAPMVVRALHDPDSASVIEENVNGALTRTYVLPEVGDEVLVAFTAPGEARYHHYDDLGNVLALTDAAGNVMERYDYDDYGRPHFLDAKGVPITDATGSPVTESPAGNPFLFHGMQWDAETGLYCGSGAKHQNPYYHENELAGEMPTARGNRLFVGGLSWSPGSAPYDPKLGRPLTRRAADVLIDMKDQSLKKGFVNPWSGGGGGGGTLRSHEDVYVWKICHCGKKTCSYCKGKKKQMEGSGGGGTMKVMFNPREYTITKVTVRGWDPKKKEEIVGQASPASTGGKWKTFRGGGLILHETAGVTRSMVHDFEKNTENVSGGFGLMGVSEPLVHTYRWRPANFALREGGRTVGAGQVIEIIK